MEVQLEGTLKTVLVTAKGVNGRAIELRLTPGGMHLRAPEGSPPRVMVGITSEGSGGASTWEERDENGEFDVYAEELELFAEMFAVAAREARKSGALRVPRVVED